LVDPIDVTCWPAPSQPAWHATAMEGPVFVATTTCPTSATASCGRSQTVTGTRSKACIRSANVRRRASFGLNTLIALTSPVAQSAWQWVSASRPEPMTPSRTGPWGDR
jgi:hypothetical protein